MKIRAQAVVFVLACCLSSLLASTLAAFPARAADDVAGQTARQHFQEGVVHYAEKRFPQARLAFIQAYALQRQPAVLLKLAESELRSGHPADAAAHFATYLRENAQAGAAERRDAEKGLAAAKARVGEVALQVDVTGAEIFVDGQPEGSSPLGGPLYLEPGNHKIEATKDGKTTAIAVQAQAGISTNATLNFGQAAAAPAAASGTAGPEAEAVGAQSPPEEDSGDDAGTGSKREPFLTWLGRRKVGWVGVGLTAVGLTGGIVFAVSASNSYNKADDVAEEIRAAAAEDRISAPCASPQTTPRPSEYVEACDRHIDDIDRGDTFRTVSIVSFIVGGAAAAGTVVYYIADSKRKEAAVAAPRGVQVRLTPVTTTSFGGLLVSGEF